MSLITQWPKIHVVVVNPSQFKHRILKDHFLFGGSCPLEGYKCLKFAGADVETFLQRQLTNDIEKLDVNSFQISTRLTQKGRVLAIFYLIKTEDAYLAISTEKILENLYADLDKYLIMEDVAMSYIGGEYRLNYLKPLGDNDFKSNIFGEPVYISQNKSSDKGLDLKDLNFSFGLEGFQELVDADIFINESNYFECSVSMSKGCYLGQETVAKIDSRKGPSFFPVYLEPLEPIELSENVSFNSKEVGKFLSINNSLAMIRMAREFRVHNKNWKFDQLEAKVYQFINDANFTDYRFEAAVELFHLGKLDSAIDVLENILLCDPNFKDGYEIAGVIYGKMGDIDRAINFMHKLIEVDPLSVMAYTNLSVFYLKKGDIETAEEYKAKATIKSFDYYGEKAKEDKDKELKKKQYLEELKRKEGMFLKVLSIDENDVLANFGLGEIYFETDNFIKAQDFFMKVLKENSSHSKTYYYLGRILEDNGNKTSALEYYEKGIAVATKQGEMMPANMMQSRINEISNESRR